MKTQQIRWSIADGWIGYDANDAEEKNRVITFFDHQACHTQQWFDDLS